MKQLCSDKKHLIIAIFELCAVIIYVVCIHNFHKTAIFLSWVVTVATFLGGTVYSVIKKRWIITSVHLAFAILAFLSLMVVSYPL